MKQNTHSACINFIMHNIQTFLYITSISTTDSINKEYLQAFLNIFLLQCHGIYFKKDVLYLCIKQNEYFRWIPWWHMQC